MLILVCHPGQHIKRKSELHFAVFKAVIDGAEQ
jgi:hypothetical protein